MKFSLLLATACLALSFPVAAQADGALMDRIAPDVPQDGSNVSPGSAPAGEPGDAGPADAAEPQPVVNTCAYNDLIGKRAESIDKSRFGDKFVRTLKPGQMVTMEYREDRVNLQVDDAGIIVGVTCG